MHLLDHVYATAISLVVNNTLTPVLVHVYRVLIRIECFYMFFLTIDGAWITSFNGSNI